MYGVYGARRETKELLMGLFLLLVRPCIDKGDDLGMLEVFQHLDLVGDPLLCLPQSSLACSRGSTQAT